MKKLLSVLVALMMLCAVPAMAEKLTMATNATFPPYEYVDEGSAFGGFAGIDVEVADAIAKKLGYDYSLQQKVYNVLPQITLQDLVKFVNENIANKPFRYIILGDESDIDMKSLEKIGPVKKLSTEEIFGY